MFFTEPGLRTPQSTETTRSIDFWLVKTDSLGNHQWDKTYGGAGRDYAFSLVQSSDSGYAIAGFTASFGVGSYDFWLVKTDSLGNAQWSNTYGGADDDTCNQIVKTIDGGFALGGYTGSFGAGSVDFWLVKLGPLVIPVGGQWEDFGLRFVAPLMVSTMLLITIATSFVYVRRKKRI